MAYTDCGEIRTVFSTSEIYISVDDLLSICENVEDIPKGTIREFMKGAEIISTVSKSGDKTDYYNAKDVFHKLPKLSRRYDDFYVLVFDIILPAVLEEYKEWLIEWTIKQVGVLVKKRVDSIYPSTIKRSV